MKIRVAGGRGQLGCACDDAAVAACCTASAPDLVILDKTRIRALRIVTPSWRTGVAAVVARELEH